MIDFDFKQKKKTTKCDKYFFNFNQHFYFAVFYYRKMSFIFGGVSTVILLLFMFVDEDVAHIEHILQVVSIFTLLAIVSRCDFIYFIPFYLFCQCFSFQPLFPFFSVSLYLSQSIDSR